MEPDILLRLRRPDSRAIGTPAMDLDRTSRGHACQLPPLYPGGTLPSLTLKKSDIFDEGNDTVHFHGAKEE